MPRRSTVPALALLLLAACDAEEPAATMNAAPAEAEVPTERDAGEDTTAPAAAPEPPEQANRAEPAEEPVSECRRDRDTGAVIAANRLKALGTEPFWAARIEGRCVTYMTPEDQDGTRIWTDFDGSRDSGTWTGFHDQRPFVLRTRPEPGCSDGMSDNRYPIAVTLLVGGEERTGCAEPL
jgi:uncharacterized membrane protein